MQFKLKTISDPSVPAASLDLDLNASPAITPEISFSPLVSVAGCCNGDGVDGANAVLQLLSGLSFDALTRIGTLGGDLTDDAKIVTKDKAFIVQNTAADPTVSLSVSSLGLVLKGEVTLVSYPLSRNDGQLTKALGVDANGKLILGPVSSFTASDAIAALAQPAGQILVGTGTGVSSYAGLKWESNTLTVNQELKLYSSNGLQVVKAGPNQRLILGDPAETDSAYINIYGTGSGYGSSNKGSVDICLNDARPGTNASFSVYNFSDWVERFRVTKTLTRVATKLEVTGNTLLGTTTDNGNRLQVNGTITVNNTLRAIDATLDNTQGTALDLRAGRGKGSATSGNVNIWTAPAGVPGSTLNTERVVASYLPDGKYLVGFSASQGDYIAQFAGAVYAGYDTNNYWKYYRDSGNRSAFYLYSNHSTYGGGYFDIDAYDEAFMTLRARKNTAGNVIMRFGNRANKFVIEKLNDAGTSIVSTPFVIDNAAGNVGIGTTNPGGGTLGKGGSGFGTLAVDVVSTGRPVFAIKSDNTNNSATLLLSASTAATYDLHINHDYLGNTSFHQYSPGTSRSVLYFKNGGNVGVNMVNPTAQFQVHKTDTTNPSIAEFSSTSAGTQFWINDSKNYKVHDVSGLIILETTDLAVFKVWSYPYLLMDTESDRINIYRDLVMQSSTGYIRGMDGTVGLANQVGQNLNYSAGRSTGSAAGGSHNFYVTGIGTAGGTTLNSEALAMSIASSKGVTFHGGILTVNAVSTLVHKFQGASTHYIDFQNGGSPALRVGMNSGSGWIEANGTVTVNSTSSQIHTISNTARYQLTNTGMFEWLNTATTVGSSTVRGLYAHQSLKAIADDNVLVGLDIAPTYDVGTYVGVKKLALRVYGDTEFLTLKTSTTAPATTGQCQVVVTDTNGLQSRTDLKVADDDAAAATAGVGLGEVYITSTNVLRGRIS